VRAMRSSRSVTRSSSSEARAPTSDVDGNRYLTGAAWGPLILGHATLAFGGRDAAAVRDHYARAPTSGGVLLPRRWSGAASFRMIRADQLGTEADDFRAPPSPVRPTGRTTVSVSPGAYTATSTPLAESGPAWRRLSPRRARRDRGSGPPTPDRPLADEDAAGRRGSGRRRPRSRDRRADPGQHGR